jgi:hypothetical protein
MALKPISTICTELKGKEFTFAMIKEYAAMNRRITPKAGLRT